jgi:hypothetical protein
MSGNFEASLEHCWDELRAIRGIFGKVLDDRLKREMRYVWETGRNSRSDPAQEAKAVASIEAINKTIVASFNLVTALEQLPPVSRNDFDVLFENVPGLSVYLQFNIDDLISNTNLHVGRLNIARRLLALSAGLPPGSVGEVKSKHKTVTNDLLKTVHSAMVSWKAMTGKEVGFPKGQDGNKRPQQEDAYFVFLCLRMVAGLKEPKTAISAIRRLRNINNEFEGAADKEGGVQANLRAVQQNLAQYEAQMRRKFYDLDT